MTARHVVFGTGPLGRATAQALIRRGQAVALASRGGSMPEPPDGAQVIAADLNDPSAARGACEGAAAVYLCAQPPYHQWPGLFPALQAAAIEAAASVGARLVVGENLYGYGPVKQVMTEDLSLVPNTRKGRVRADMHRDLMAAHDAGRVAVAVARGSDFFGPWVAGSAVGERAFRAVVQGRPAEVYGDSDAPHSYTFVEDFGTALAILGTDDRGAGQVWHVPNAPAVSTRRFLELAFRLAEQPSRLKRFTRLELGLIGLFVPPVRESIEMLYEFEQPFVVDHSKFIRTFGDISTPLEAALARTIDWTRGHLG
ncbi:NAD-dependent epimerase/dehydratase family protein [Brevundimonas sp.]|uniref:NAD-dependent epimerase/dehydratase family protein n=1 Tax=Brevundimonas sp. TaxID=1871086 RepID=UPI00263219D5|nr:NAD-dependent epimerase/dehydratase family protein [Brevundimonas sp.]